MSSVPSCWRTAGAGVPISIISKWAGHYDPVFTLKTYAHASDEDLQRGQAPLARIHKIA